MKSLLPSKPRTTGSALRTEAAGATGTTGAAPAPGPLASFLRFVISGGGVGVLSSFAVTLLAMTMPWAVSNAIITVASTLLCTELHARFTFAKGRSAGWREHWQSAGSATAAYMATSVAMYALHLAQPSAGTLTEQIVYLGASGLAGAGRFVILRLYVFAGQAEQALPARIRRAPALKGIGGLRTSPRLAVS